MSSQLQGLDIPLDAFTAQADASVWRFTVSNDVNEIQFAREVGALKPAMIVALGPTAAALALTHFPEVPTVIALVVNHRRLRLQERPNVVVIALETQAVAEFVQYQMVLPQLRRVLAFYKPDESGESVALARKQLADIDVDVLAVPIATTDEIPGLYEKHKRSVDALWLLNDSVVMNEQTFAVLRRATLRDRLPFIASLSEDFAKAGALMSVSVDFHAIGGQLLLLEKQLVEQRRAPSDIGEQAPIGSRLVVNMDVAKRIGVTIPRDVLPFIARANP